MGQIRAITHVGRADKTQTLSVTLCDICFSFRLHSGEVNLFHLINGGCTQDTHPPLCVEWCHLLTLMAVR